MKNIFILTLSFLFFSNGFGFSAKTLLGDIADYCGLNFDSMSNCLKNHEEAFKKFESEAKNVKVHVRTRQEGNLLITTHSYTPDSENLRNYLHAHKKLMKKINTHSIINGTIIALVMCLICRKIYPNEYPLTVIFEKKKSIGLSLLGAAILSTIILENKLRNKVPYFDEDTMYKDENLFGTINVITIKRTIYTALSVFVGALCIPLLIMMAEGKAKTN